MRQKFLTIPLVIALMLTGRGLEADSADMPAVSAKAAAVISADTGQLVCGKNEGEKLPMASTTKIMTTLLTIESGDLDTPFVVDSDAIKVEGSSMGLQEGDTVTKYALCCGMLLPSGNDAANAAAVRIAGSIPDFAQLMNDRARDMGLSKTWFVTPSGLEGEGHGSSAYDMARLAAFALKEPVFREICSSETICTQFGNPPYKRYLKNTNKLLAMDEGVYGVKTGFTDEAGRCLVSACERDGKRLICVTLNAPDDWNDHLALYDYAFPETESIVPEIPEDITAPLAGSDREMLVLSADDVPAITVAENAQLHYEVKLPPFVYAPVRKGDLIGSITVRCGNMQAAEIPLYSAENADYKTAGKAEKKHFNIKDLFRKWFS